MNHISFFDVVVPGLFVASLAAVGFNRPSWSRTFTTAVRYRAAQIAHVALYLLLLLLLYQLLERGFALKAYFAPPDSTPDPVILLWMALGLTVLVRALPGFAFHLRNWAHQRAEIPACALRFANTIACAPFKASAPTDMDARVLLMARGIDVANDMPPISQPAQLLLRATALFLELRKWEDDRRFRRFAVEAKHDFEYLRRRFDRLSFRIARTFETILRMGEMRHASSHGGDEPAPSAEKLDGLVRRVVGDLIADCCEDIEGFYGDACRLTARCALTLRSTRGGRNRLIGSLGFTLEAGTKRDSIRVLIQSAAIVITSLLFFLLILPVPRASISANALNIVIALNVVGALAFAIVPKLYWGFANASLRQEEPVRFIIAAGVLAALFSAINNFLAGAFLSDGAHGVSGGLQRLYDALPWPFSLFATAATVAWLVQDHRWAEMATPARRRLCDAAVWGLVSLLSSIGMLWQVHLGALEPTAAAVMPRILTSIAYGVVLGYTIPESIRANEMSLPVFETFASLPKFVSTALQRTLF